MMDDVVEVPNAHTPVNELEHEDVDPGSSDNAETRAPVQRASQQ